MRTLPDVRTTKVSTEGGDADIVWMPALQPDDPNEIRARIRLGPGRLMDGVRLLRLTDGRWTDQGLAPSLSRDSWHPELPDDLGEAIELTRRVIEAIPHCSKVLIAPECESTSNGFRVGSSAIFYEEDESGCHGIVSEHTLDRTPFVRAVERIGEAFGEWLNVQAHDDGSGVAGDLAIDVSATGLSVTFDDESDGCVLSLTSDLEDGSWIHRTVLRFPIYEDAMGVLRAIADPVPELTGFASGSETWKDIVRHDARGEVEIENNVMTFIARPGTLLRVRD